MTVDVVTPTTSNPLNRPQGRDRIAAAFMSKYGVDMKKAQNLTSGYLDAVQQVKIIPRYANRLRSGVVILRQNPSQFCSSLIFN